MLEFPKRLQTIQRRLRFFDFSLENLGIANRQGYFIDLNRSWEEVLGHDLDTLRSRPYYEFIHPDDQAVTRARLGELEQKGDEAVRFWNRCRCKDGSYRWMMWSCRLADQHVYVVGRDIHWLTSEGRAQERKARGEAFSSGADSGSSLDMGFAFRRQRFFEFSLDLLCIATSQGYFIDLNPSWERTLGYSLDELTSKPFLDFVHPDDREPTLAEAARLQEPNTYTVGFANRYRCKDGSYRWLHWYTRVVEGYFYAVARDITDLVKQTEDGDVQASLLLDPEAMRRLDEPQ
jgi:rsbT co-antagonist protein RsbR